MNEPCLSPLPGSPGSNEELAAKPGDSLLLYLGHIHDGISQLYWLLYLACSRPSEVFGRHYLNVLVIPGPLPSTWDILLQTGEDVCAEGLAFLIKAAGHFITAPWYSPEDHARRLYTERARTRDVDKQREATRLHAPKGWDCSCCCLLQRHRLTSLASAVRVKWYPDLEAPLKPWSEGLAELWTDLPIQADGSIDLRPLKRMWGMENIYVRPLQLSRLLRPKTVPNRQKMPQVIDANHGRRMRIGRRPDEVLSGLAWTVLLGRHDVLGVVGASLPRTPVFSNRFT
ncbi:hypothetical protein FKP32DRAFT_947917 [Trametes sanguinea]|nr:hypothetical protein FKP32DRAFT_947917 [Trametes sanguinea]